MTKLNRRTNQINNSNFSYISNDFLYEIAEMEVIDVDVQKISGHLVKTAYEKGSNKRQLSLGLGDESNLNKSLNGNGSTLSYRNIVNLSNRLNIPATEISYYATYDDPETVKKEIDKIHALIKNKDYEKLAKVIANTDNIADFKKGVAKNMKLLATAILAIEVQEDFLLASDFLKIALGVLRDEKNPLKEAKINVKGYNELDIKMYNVLLQTQVELNSEEIKDDIIEDLIIMINRLEELTFIEDHSLLPALCKNLASIMLVHTKNYDDIITYIEKGINYSKKYNIHTLIPNLLYLGILTYFHMETPSAIECAEKYIKKYFNWLKVLEYPQEYIETRWKELIQIKQN